MPTEYRIGRLNGKFVVTWWGGDGKRRRYRLAAGTREEATGEAADLIRNLRAKAAGSTIDELWQLYRREKQGRRVAETMDFEWRKMKPFFGHLRPEQITSDLCREYAAVRRKTIGRNKRKIQDGSIWTELGHLRTVFRWAADRKLIPFAPPVERPAKPAPKDRWLTEAEVRRLVAAAPEHHIKLAVLLMISTAARIGAVLELTWDRVDFEGGKVNLRTSELGPRKGRAIVPMNDGLRAALSAAREVAMTDHVVEWGGQPVKSIKTGFRSACKLAGLTGVTPHTLRHTAAVHLAAAGTPMSKISQYLGHSSTAITEKVYARFAPDHLREEAAILDFTSRPRAARS